MTAPVFECYPVAKGSCIAHDPSYFTTDEADAVAWAKANATRDREQVTIEVSVIGDVSTFAIRHFRLESGEVTDTGWSCWRHGDRVSTTSLDALFAESPRLFRTGAVA